MSVLTVDANQYAHSGLHNFLAELESGIHFKGIYVVRVKPTLTVARGEECYCFWIEDLSGRLKCTIPTYKIVWHDSADFQSQRLYIEGYTDLEGTCLVGRLKTIDPVHMVW